MQHSSAGLISKAYAVFSKDLRLELRSKYALNTILMFGITTLAMVSFSVGQSGLSPRLLSALYWIIMFFSSTAGLAQVFIREEEAGTALALKLTADADAVYLGKLFFNFLLLSMVTIIVTVGFFIFTDASTGNLWALIILIFLGVVCLCASTTLIAAIIAKASIKGSLFAVLSFPILVVPLFTLVDGTAKALASEPFAEISWHLQGLVAFGVVMITLSIMLFEFVWNE